MDVETETPYPKDLSVRDDRAVGVVFDEQGQSLPAPLSLNLRQEGRDVSRRVPGFNSYSPVDSSLDSALMLSEWNFSSSTERSAISFDIASVNSLVELPFSPSPK